ncbi:MAG: hypothetical protein M1817_003857 [Caeruleum heppii]|nr:MAG: hypothetical protein M1817_003857 [Caeruleum heppii]
MDPTPDIVLQLRAQGTWTRHNNLAVFDMDSTLIQQEVIDEIAQYLGVEEEVSAITARAMNGEIDFEASLRARVALLKGTPADVFDRLKPNIQITPGARELCRHLKKMGFKLAVLSGGFVPLARWLASELQLDYAYANNVGYTLVVSSDGNTLTGELEGLIVHAQRKADLLVQIAEKEGIPLTNTLAVGDGANDLLMMKKAALGIAFNAKPKVQEEAPARLNSDTLLDILHLLGIERHI